MENRYNLKKKLSTKNVVSAGMLIAISVILTRFFSLMIPLVGLPALRIGFGDIPVIISGMLFGPIVGGLTGIVSDLLGYVINPMGGAYFIGFTLSAALRGVIPGLIYLVIRTNKFKLNFNIVNSISTILLTIGVLNIMYSQKVLTFKDNAIYLNNSKLSLLFIVLFLAIVLAFILVPIVFSKVDKEKKSIYSLDKVLFVVTVSYLIISLALNTLWLSIMFKKGFLIFLPPRVLAGLVMIPLHSLIIFTLTKFLRKLI